MPLFSVDATLPIMAYLMKPVNEQELLTTLQMVMARFEEQQQVLQRAAGWRSGSPRASWWTGPRAC
jgi:YesN/AraC family two-component response regulator